MRGPRITHAGPSTGIVSYWVGRFWMALFGWDVDGEFPAVSRAVLIAAPHTSNWDLPHMLAAAFVYRLRISWMGKHTLFKGPFGWFFRLLGGVPVDRRAPGGLVTQAAGTLRSAERLILAVPPSGTRGRSDYWKSGFYWIAKSADVPIVCGYLDFARKRAGIGLVVHPSGDIAADMDRIRSYYADIRGLFPENQSRIRLRAEDGGSDAG